MLLRMHTKKKKKRPDKKKKVWKYLKLNLDIEALKMNR